MAQSTFEDIKAHAKSAKTSPFIKKYLSDGLIDYIRMRQDADDGLFDLKTYSVFMGNFHTVKNVVATSKDNKVLLNGFLKHSQDLEHYAEYLYYYLGKQVDLSFVKTYLCLTHMGTNYSWTNNLIDRDNLKLIEGHFFLPGGSSRNCVEQVCTGLANFRGKITCFSGEKPLTFSPKIFEDITKLALFDFCFGQTDRHCGNYGFLVDTAKSTLTLAPIWDNGFVGSTQNQFDVKNFIADFYKRGDEVVLDEKFGTKLPIFNYNKFHDADFSPKEFLADITSPYFPAFLHRFGIDIADLTDFVGKIDKIDISETINEATQKDGTSVPECVGDMLEVFKVARTYILGEALEIAEKNVKAFVNNENHIVGDSSEQKFDDLPLEE